MTVHSGMANEQEPLHSQSQEAANDNRKTGPGILVPLDGSSLAELALPHAAALSQRLQGRLILVNVYPDGGPGFDQNTTYQIAREYDSAARSYMSGPLNRLSEAGIAAEGIARAGEAPATICDVVKEQNISLIVMTTHGRSGIQRAFLGSVSDAVLRTSPVPVVVVRPGQELPAEFAFLATMTPDSVTEQ